MNSLTEMQARNGASDGEKKFYEQPKDVAKVIQSHAQEGRGQAVHSDRTDPHSLSMQRQLRQVKLTLRPVVVAALSPQATTHTHTHTHTNTHTHTLQVKAPHLGLWLSSPRSPTAERITPAATSAPLLQVAIAGTL